MRNVGRVKFIACPVCYETFDPNEQYTRNSTHVESRIGDCWTLIVDGTVVHRCPARTLRLKGRQR